MPPMMYDEQLVAPMREDLGRVGFEDLRTAAAVDEAMARPGTAMVVVNSVCGCSARMARPAVRQALRTSPVQPNHLLTVFAGQDSDATQRARSYFTGYPPSSPCVALLRDGKLQFIMERWQIEGRHADEIALDLADALAKHCSPGS